MTSTIYRSMPDTRGEAAREAAAISTFARWREQLQTRVILIAALLGLVPGTLSWCYVAALQAHALPSVRMRGHLVVDAGAAAAAWIVVLFVGLYVAKRLVQGRVDAKIESLSRSHAIPVARLTPTLRIISAL